MLLSELLFSRSLECLVVEHRDVYAGHKLAVFRTKRHTNILSTFNGWMNAVRILSLLLTLDFFETNGLFQTKTTCTFKKLFVQE